jgi:hypothetical protein
MNMSPGKLTEPLIVTIEAESGLEYFYKDAEDDCFRKLEENLQKYLRENGYEKHRIYVDQIESITEHPAIIDEYVCKCSRKLTVYPD